MKRRRMLCRGLLYFCMIFVMLFSVSAAGAGKKAELLLKYEHDGAAFRIYQVTGAEGRKTGVFKDCDIPMDTGTNAGLQRTAKALADFAEEQKAEPQGTGKVSGNRLSFAGLDAGWYLVCGEELKEGKYTYTPAPFLVLLSEGRKQVSDVKADETENPTDPTNPSNPTDPSEPTDPSDPADPSDPTNPSDPTDPSNPTNPSDPADPSNPTSPSDPTNPSDPTSPSSPTDPDNPTAPGDHGGRDDNDNDDNDDDTDRPGRPVRPDQGGSGGDGQSSSIDSFSAPENVEHITLDQAELPTDPPTAPESAAIPKLGDMGAAGYFLGMVTSLGLCALLLLLRRRLKCGREK